MASQIPEVSEDEIFERKILMDGEMGDDRMLTSFLKSYLEFAYAKYESEEERQVACQSLLNTVSELEHRMLKSRLVQEMHQREINNYDLVQKELEAKIEESRESVKRLRVELQESKEKLKKRQMYSAYAKVIKQLPDRKTSLKETEKATKELEVLNERRAKLRTNLKWKTTNISVMKNSAQELMKKIKSEEKSKIKEEEEKSKIKEEEEKSKIKEEDKADVP